MVNLEVFFFSPLASPKRQGLRSLSMWGFSAYSCSWYRANPRIFKARKSELLCILPWESNSVLQPTISAQRPPSSSCLLAGSHLECRVSTILPSSSALRPVSSSQGQSAQDRNIPASDMQEQPKSSGLGRYLQRFAGHLPPCGHSNLYFLSMDFLQPQNLLVLGETGEKGGRERRNSAVYESNS
ncbi:hypothetical protein HJG60_011684 [Phyllostomus discolor]|uniref:Uncharacterized protein n=1 Tax=Phyllostomus discolor TaxID=89673 RepID=A0A833ZVV8_9CHIR|nr:hypothetical protein HJG60_011684 [Phyllostomus discolor]